MDVTLDIQTIDVHSDFMDIHLKTLIEICQAFTIPKKMFDGIGRDRWARLYQDGSYDVLSFE